MSKSPLNKTIDTGLEEGREYLERCLTIQSLRDQAVPVSDCIICADMFDACKFIPEQSVDLMIVDPPYNLDKDYNGKSFQKMKKSDYEVYTRSWLQATKHVVREGGSVYVCCDWESSLIIGAIMGEFYTVRNRITWQREKGRGAKANWKNSMEDIWFATKDISPESKAANNGMRNDGSSHGVSTGSFGYTFNIDDVKIRRRVIAPYREEGKPKDWQETDQGKFRDTHPSNFWDDITIPFWSMAENTAHPAQKPEKLMARLILASSNEGGLVFDPFAGSGSTCVTAKKLGRHFIGIERDPRYCIWAQQRLEMAEKDKTIQGYEDGVFWERNARK